MPKSTRMISAAARFRRFRKSKKMTQRMLGMLLGITRRSVISIEQGKHEPSLRHLSEFDALVERHKQNEI
jgi:DNA-binding XRE family transcriptional regulator